MLVDFGLCYLCIILLYISFSLYHTFDQNKFWNIIVFIFGTE